MVLGVSKGASMVKPKWGYGSHDGDGYNIVPGHLSGSIGVFVDNQHHCGILSYNVPDGMRVKSGDAVHVPFGSRELHGIVVGESLNDLATKDIIKVFGPRASVVDLQVAKYVAYFHCVPLHQVLTRLSPRSGRGEVAAVESTVELSNYSNATKLDPEWFSKYSSRYILCAPLVNLTQVVSEVAKERSKQGQVLIICPTTELVDGVLEKFSSGAARLDSQRSAGVWGAFRAGLLPIGVSTRAGVLYSGENLKSIIIVEDSSVGHVELTQPQTHSRNIAKIRHDIAGLDLSIISSKPTADGCYCVSKVLEVGDPATDWPHLVLVDRNNYPPSSKAVPPILKKVLTKNTLIIAQNRPSVHKCKKCGLPKECDTCGITSFCTHRSSTPCVTCGGTSYYWLGWDASRIVDTVGPAPRVCTIKNINDNSTLLDDIDTVVFFDFDSATRNDTDLRPGDTSAKALLDVLSYGSVDRTVYICTSSPEHWLLKATFADKSVKNIAKYMYNFAKINNLPPFKIEVTIKSGNNINFSGWPSRVYGPKIDHKGEREWFFLIDKADLTKIRARIYQIRGRGKTRVRIY